MPSTDRRRFTRVPFEADTELTVEGHKDPLRLKLLDLSLKGALLEAPEEAFDVGETGILKVFFEGSDIVIEMNAEIRHCDESSLGLACTPVDIDSVAHLKRLIELNTGDSSLLDREVAMMHQSNLEEQEDHEEPNNDA